MMLMAAATDLLVIFLALEMLSLAVYVLTGIRRASADRRRGGVQVLPARRLLERVLPLRHRLRRSRSSGSTRLEQLGVALSAQGGRRAADAGAARGRPAGGRLRVQGLGGAVPHVDAGRLRGRADDRHRVHVDRREGGGVRRVRRACSSRRSSRCRRSGSRCSAVIAGATMILGTVVGVVQTNIKRMLAYSSIAHAGYLLLGHRRREQRRQGGGPVLSAVLRGHRTSARSASSRCSAPPQHEHDELRDFAGLWQSRPGLAGADDGVPAVARRLPADSPASSASGTSSAPRSQEGHYWLAIIGVLTSVVSVFFYLRIVVMMYMTEGPRDRTGRACPPPRSPAWRWPRSRCSTWACCRPVSCSWRSIRSRRFSKRDVDRRGLERERPQR